MTPLPAAGWKVRSRPRGTQAGQLLFLFLAPDRAISPSRRKVMDHMEKLGLHPVRNFEKVREGGKNPNRFSGNGTRKLVLAAKI